MFASTVWAPIRGGIFQCCSNLALGWLHFADVLGDTENPNATATINTALRARVKTTVLHALLRDTTTSLFRVGMLATVIMSHEINNLKNGR